MNLFEAQARAQRKSRLLVVYFILAVLAIVVGVNLAAYGAFFAAGTQEGMAQARPPEFIEPMRWFWISLVTVAVIVVASLLRSAQLRQGGGYVARSLGARKIDPTTREPLEQRLINVVEEMAIASGVPMPEVYVLDEESGINAFAAGHDPQDAAVAVTRGTLENLSRDELQGVIAHEFSHILNGDMRINVRMIGVLFGILMIAIVGRMLMYTSMAGRHHGSGQRGKGGGGAIVLFGVAVMLIGFLGEFFGRLIQSALSRQREYLADAAAVQFTRNPDGIAGALKRIGGAAGHGRIDNQRAAGMAHCFFANALATRLGGALATHPPLPKRIRAIDPQWDGQFPAPGEKRSRTEPKPKPKPEAGSPAAAGADFIHRAAMVGAIGSLGQENVQSARALIEALPGTLRDAAHDPIGAVGIILALVLDNAGEPRAAQLALIAESVDTAVHDSVTELLPLVNSRKPRERLPLAELALPSLYGVSEEKKRLLLDLVDRLVRQDNRVTLYEFCLGTLIAHRLNGGRTVDRATDELPLAIGRLLSKVVALEVDDAEQAKAAFDESLEPLRGRIATPPFCAPGTIELPDLRQDLEAVRRSPLPLRRHFLEACEIAIRRDKQISIPEADLFRVVAACIDCPVPLID